MLMPMVQIRGVRMAVQGGLMRVGVTVRALGRGGKAAAVRVVMMVPIVMVVGMVVG